MEIKDVLGLKHHLRPCSQLKIHRRKYHYSHHVFIGSVDQFGCDIYQYKFVLKPWWKFYSPAQVTKERLDYSSYWDNKEIRKIFNFENGDTVVLVNRNDYPQNKDAEEKCIKRAESRVGGRNYSTAFNNCESYVNWVFSGDNTSGEYENAHLLKQMFANVIDVMTVSGVFKLFDLILRPWYSSRSLSQQTSQKQNGIDHDHRFICKKERREIPKEKQALSNLELDVYIENISHPESPILKRHAEIFKPLSSFCHTENKETDASTSSISLNIRSFTDLISNSEKLKTSNEIIALEVEESIGSMVRGGTRFADCDIFGNNKQNTQRCTDYRFFFQFADILQNDNPESLKSFETTDRRNEYDLAFAIEGIKLGINSYRNFNDGYMTGVQRRNRVYRDTISTTSGFYGCVYGANVATTMFPGSFDIAANIGCTAGGLFGNAAGAVGFTALLH